jgi:single-strand DNA-binding protein
MRYTPNGKAVTTFDIAIDRPFAAEGEQKADFIRVVTWGALAETVANYCRKGWKVGVSGRIQSGSYQAREGHKVYTTEVVADTVDFLARPAAETNGAAS